MSLSDDDWNAIERIYQEVGIPSDCFLAYPKILLHFMAVLKKRVGREFHAESVCNRLLSERKSGHLPGVGDPTDVAVQKKFEQIREEVSGTAISSPMCKSQVVLKQNAGQ